MASIIYDDKELMKSLLEAGVHFGHQTKRWNPKMKRFIFMKRNGIYIIDLRKTMDMLKKAYEAMKKIAERGGMVLFVGTKKQAQGSIMEEAQRASSHYVNKRWLGGTLTNYSTLKKSVDKLKKLEKRLELERDKLTKKSISTLEKKISRMKGFYEGIRDMKRIPDAIWVVDLKREMNAILEAKKLGIPIFGIADTNCDPDLLDHIVPGNDDAIRAARLLTALMADAIIEGANIAIKKSDIEATETKEETPKEEAKEKTPKEEVKEETPKEEIKEETPKEEVKEETPKEEAKEKTPKEEAKEKTPKEEAKEKTPKEEAKDKTPKEEAKKKTSKKKIKEKAPKEETPAEETKASEAKEDVSTDESDTKEEPKKELAEEVSE